MIFFDFWVLYSPCGFAYTGAMRPLAYAALLACTAPFIPCAQAKGDLAQDLKSGAVWEMEGAAFQQKYLEGERAEWVDAGKTAMRLPRPTFTIGSLKLGETVIKWQEGKPVSMQIMVYNKGDDGLVSEKRFEEIIDNARTVLTESMGVPATPYKPGRKETAVKMKAWVWGVPQSTISLEASESGNRKEFEAEFVRLRINSENAAGDSDKAQRNDLKANVKKEDKRVLIEGVPMVDQGQKGYCAVATAARIFSYYGSDNVDQHELASIANTEAGGGTSSREMMEAIKKVGSRFQVRVRSIDGFETYADYQKLVKAYNREARKQKKNMMAENVAAYSNFWDMANGEVLKATRAGKPADVERWMKPVRTWINAGVPVLWSVQLGLVPEPMRISQTRGGHMRLIIGYDDEKKTILFSDSWGQEHSCKEMPMDDAVAITTSRAVLIPSR